jgi:hypothetical protein
MAVDMWWAIGAMVFILGPRNFGVWIARWSDAVKHQDANEEVGRRHRQWEHLCLAVPLAEAATPFSPC